MTIAYHGPNRKLDVTYHDSWQSLAQAFDFLVLALSDGQETQHIVNAGVFQALRPKGFLINVAEGSVVDEDALFQTVIDWPDYKGWIRSLRIRTFDQLPPDDFGKCCFAATYRQFNQRNLAPHERSCAR